MTSGPEDEEDDNFNFRATWNMIKRIADQISHPALAVAELIKNSYDADATEVLINMKEAMGSNIESNRLVINDNGHGMTKKDIQTKWSKLGVSVNIQDPFSKKGRSKQGGKGLGRFGAWKIGKKVTLATRAKNNPICVLIIDFSKYDPETPIEEVMSPILIDPPAFKNMFPEGKTGTYILVEKFNETMGRTDDIQKIQRNTQTLLNPFEPQEDFKIILQLPRKFEKWEDYEIHEIINQALYKYEVSIDPRGQSIQGKFTNNNAFCESFGEQVQINFPTSDLLDGKKCQISSIKVWIYHFNKSAQYKKLWPTTNLGIFKKDDYNNNFAGFRLYKDGVRVFPYGEEGNDWLQLDYMQNKQSSGAWFNNTQIVAAARFDMTSNNGVIMDKSNREGLEDTIGKQQLFQILQKLVKDMRSRANPIPKEQPSHLKDPDFDYGSVKLVLGTSHNLLVRHVGGDVTTNYSVTKGKLPKGLHLDSTTGTVSGSPEKESDVEIKIEITAGNNQGNHTAILTISEIRKPEPIQSTLPHMIVNPPSSIEEDGNEPDIPSGPETSELDNAIKQFKNNVSQLGSEMSSSKKRELLEQLRNEIDDILEN